MVQYSINTMKLLCICFLVIFNSIQINGNEKAEKQFGEEVKQAAKECMENFKVNDDDLGALKKFEPAQTEEGNCFMKCVLQKLEVLKEEKYCGDGFLTKMKGWLGDDEEKYKKVDNMINSCKSTVESEYQYTPEDKCGISRAVMKCFHTFEEETKKLREILEKISKEE